MLEYKFSNLTEYLQIITTLPATFGCHPSDLWYRGVKSDRLKLVPGVVWRGINETREMSLISEFLTYYGNYSSVRPSTSFEYYALMQHYGVPTRLLDWSLSPLIALYFALEAENNNATRVIWALCPLELNKKSVNSRMIMAPNAYKNSRINDYLPKYLRNSSNPVPDEPVAVTMPFSNQRITSQKGAFTLHGFSSEGVEDYCIKNNIRTIAKLSLDKEECREIILENLYAIGIKEDDVYQDLNSLSRRILREFGLN